MNFAEELYIDVIVSLNKNNWTRLPIFIGVCNILSTFSDGPLMVQFQSPAHERAVPVQLSESLLIKGARMAGGSLLSWGVPPNGSIFVFFFEKGTKIDDLGVPLFQETSTFCWNGSSPLM